MAELHDGTTHLGIFRNQRTDTDTAFRIAFGDRIDQYHVLLDTFQMTSRDIRGTGIDKLPVYLIREKIKIIFLYDIPDLIHLTTRIQITRRIVRVTDQDRFGTLIDQLLEFFHFRKRKSFLYRSRHCPDHGSCRDSECHIIGISRFRYDNLITRIQATQEGKQNSLRTTGSDDNIVSRKINIILFIISNQLLAITAISLTRAIFQHRTIDITDRIECRSRSGKVGLTDIQVIHMNSSLFGSIGQWSQLPDRGSGHFDSSL